jgi:uncharacterized membrane protein YphA (DoxX/SURF4 family)
MPIRDSIALHTCPLLLRIGLAATFLWFGIPKWNTITYTGDDARRLVNLGIGDETVVGTAPAETPAAQPAETPAQQPTETQPSEQPTEPPAEEQPDETGSDDQPPVTPDSPVSDQPAGDQPSSELQPPETEEGGPGDEAGAQETPPVTDAPVEAPAEVDEPEPSPAVQPDVEYEVRAKRVENLTLMLSKASHPYPRMFAWIAMLTETVGGGLLLIGLFSRVWGLGLSIAMVYAFALSTWPRVIED